MLNAQTEPPSAYYSPERRPLNAGCVMMPVVLAGLFVTSCAMITLLWPSQYTTDSSGVSSHIGRLTSEMVNSAPFGRVLVDASIYVLILIGFILTFMAITMRRRGLLLPLMGIGLLGLAYTSGMALFTGPMISVCGFMMILVASFIAWAASSTEAEPATQVVTPMADSYPQPAQLPEEHVLTAYGSGDIADQPETSEPADSQSSNLTEESDDNGSYPSA